MTFQTIYTDVENITNVNNERDFVKRAVNGALDKIAWSYEWPFYLDVGWITTVAEITAGDADLTNGSRSVTSDNGSTSWPASVVNGTTRPRKFRYQGQTPFYIIKARTSATALTLEQPYQGTTDTDEDYQIYQDEYRLFGDVDVEHTFKQAENGILMMTPDVTELDDLYASPNSYGDALIAAPIGRHRETYAVGTVSATAGAYVITGASTSWLDVQGLSRGNRIRIGSNVYTVRSVDSDTQITTYEAIVSTASAGTAYEIVMENPCVQLYEIPDEVKNYYYRYYRRPAPMANDYDEPDLPPQMHRLLIIGALIEMWAHKGDETRSKGALAEFQKGLQDMRLRYISTRNYERHTSVHMLRHRSLRYPQNFDVSVSR